MTPDQSKLDRRVAIALGFENSHLVHDPDKYSTDPAHVGPLLLEAKKRGWDPSVAAVDIGGLHGPSVSGWECDMDGEYVTSESLPEAICRAFVAAHDAEKAGVQ